MSTADPTDPAPPSGDNGNLGEALARIELARSTGATELDLSGLRLTSTKALGEALRDLPVEALDLTANRLTSAGLTDALPELPNLRALNLQANCLESTGELADALRDRTGLMVLYLPDNRLTASLDLADALRTLTNLVHLHLGNNKLTSTPALADALQRLTSLTMLDLSGNKRYRERGDLTLTPSLARAIGELTGLEQLSLACNEVTSTQELADALCRLEKLHGLDLSFNSLTSTPDFARALRDKANLRILDLQANALTTSTPDLANALHDKDRLEWLILEGNRLTSTSAFADALSDKANLDRLELGSNQLTSNRELADALCGLSSLTNLDLSHNDLRSEPALADALCRLRSLTNLNLSYNDLTSLPALADGLGELTNLKYLNLKSNKLASTPHLAEALQRLRKLAVLRIDGNPYLGIPAEVLYSEDPARIIRAIEANAQGRTMSRPEFKIVLLGEGGAGKSNIRQLLNDEDPSPTHDVTRSFEWQQTYREIRKEGHEAPGLVHVFDYGGQRHLWASHRFSSLSHRRSIYVIAVSAEWTLKESRLVHWLRFVKEIAHQHARWAATRELAESPGKTFAELLSEQLAVTHTPPTIVVITRSLAPKQNLNLEEVRRACKEHGATLIEGYDSCPENPGDPVQEESARRLWDEIEKIACGDHPAMRPVWEDLFTTVGLERRDRIKREFGFEPEGLSGSPARRAMNLTDYLTEICGLSGDAITNQSPEFVDVMDDLRILRDLGFVHWLGESDELPEVAWNLKERIFSPAWVRGPLYDLLWSEEASVGPLDGKRVRELITENHTMNEDEMKELLALLVAKQIIFPFTTPEGIRRYIVPDRLDPGDDQPLIKNETAFAKDERGYRLDLSFAPDHLMPQIIGLLHQEPTYTCRSMTRRSVQVEIGEGLSRLDLRIDLHQQDARLLIGVRGEEGKSSDTIALVRNWVERILHRHRELEYTPLFGAVAALRRKNAELEKEREKLIRALVLPNLNPFKDRRQLELLHSWCKLCDEKLENLPWKLAVLAGIAFARDEWLAGRMAPDNKSDTKFVKALLNALAGLPRDDIPKEWRKVLDELAPNDPKKPDALDAKVDSTRQQWKRVRQSLGKDHKWVDPGA